jgi:hypothetical protein
MRDAAVHCWGLLAVQICLESKGSAKIGDINELVSQDQWN